ncbi:MAG: oligopeptide ABC transporter ATP-binding protein OppF [Anaerolineaceae bacterium 4572_32.2]|nr:MAG: oligopeptide ABC transporter ATP-binding protein OppF [Anaerolineaceae bacterium 4572_32.2]
MSTLVQAINLVKHFPVPGGVVHAVDGLSFDIQEGETAGLVGESGCGKTTVGRTMLKLTRPTAGELRFEGRDIFSLRAKALQSLRRRMAIVFQNPYSSLNPRMKIKDIVAEPLRTHTALRGQALRERVQELLDQVGLTRQHLLRYPHEFSGGQRQRIAIARALALKPKFIVFDEPTSALDVSVQAQVLNLIRDLQKELSLTCLFISHNLSVVEHITDKIMIMYLGQIVETGRSDEIFARPLHPYTRALLSAIPSVDPDQIGEAILLKGDIPSPVHPPPGCRFHTRCPIATPACHKEEPELDELSPGHWVACPYAVS